MPSRSNNYNNDNDNGERGESTALLGEAGAAVRKSGKKVKRAWDGFIDFVFSENVLEVALGLIIASQFTRLITSFVSDILLPPVSLIPGIGKNFDEKFAILRKGTGVNGTDYNTASQARDDGAIVLAYGTFIDKVINFFVLGLTLYVLAQGYSWATEDNVVKRQIKCRYCRKRISDKAKRCFQCTTWLDGRED